MPRRLLSVAAAVLAATFGGAVLSTMAPPFRTTVRADPPRPSAGATPVPGGVIVGAASPGSQGDPGSSGSGSGSAPPFCSWVPVPANEQSIFGVGGPQPGEWYDLLCQNGTVPNFGLMWVQTASGAPPTPATLGLEAVSELRYPSAAIEMAPPTNTGTVVGLSTWLWVNPAVAQTLTATATAGGVSATATAQLYDVVWTMGDGSQVTCYGPGTPYNPSVSDQAQHTGCGYTYQQSSGSQPGQRYTVTANVYWHVTWAARGAPGGGDLGLLAGPSSTTQLEVDEIHAINQ